jgi:ABC-type Fe3+ transport system substrate-binding protein
MIMRKQGKGGKLQNIWKNSLVLGTAMVVGAVLSVSAAAIEMTPALKKIVNAANKEGIIRIHMGASPIGRSSGVKAAENGINKMFGTKIKLSFKPGPAYAALGSKLLTEYQAKQPASSDIYIATAIQLVPLLRKGLFTKVDWQGLFPERVQPQMVEADGQVLRHYTSLPGVIYKKSMEAKVKKARTLEDFLKPDWKGKFWTTPYLAGFDVLIADEVWGAKKTENYVLRMSQQIGGLLGCGATSRIASGEMPVHLIDCSGSAAFSEKFKSLVGLHILKETAWRRYGYFAIPKNSRAKNAATLYALWYASKEGQESMRKHIGYDMTDHPESHFAQVIAGYIKQGYNFRDVTIDWWGAQKGVIKQHRKNIKLLRSKAKRK